MSDSWNPVICEGGPLDGRHPPGIVPDGCYAFLPRKHGESGPFRELSAVQVGRRPHYRLIGYRAYRWTVPA